MFNNFFFITLSKFLFHFSFVFVLHFNGRRLTCEGDTFMSKLRHAFSSSFRAGRSFKLRVESRNSLQSCEFLWDFAEFQAFPWDFQGILSKHKGLHEGHGNCHPIWCQGKQKWIKILTWLFFGIFCFNFWNFGLCVGFICDLQSNNQANVVSGQAFSEDSDYEDGVQKCKQEKQWGVKCKVGSESIYFLPLPTYFFSCSLTTHSTLHHLNAQSRLLVDNLGEKSR